MSIVGCLPFCHGKGKSYEAKKKDKELTQMLKKWKQEEQERVQILMLGIGESGKSTITKQMKIIHINGFSDA